jgi:phage/plasmid-associated DNA primase
MDVLGDFLTECCVLGARYAIPKAELYAGYMAWCEQTHERPVSKRTFTRLLEDRGIGEARDKKTRYYSGIALVTDGDTSSISVPSKLTLGNNTEYLSPSVTIDAEPDPWDEAVSDDG